MQTRFFVLLLSLVSMETSFKTLDRVSRKLQGLTISFSVLSWQKVNLRRATVNCSCTAFKFTVTAQHFDQTSLNIYIQVSGF